MGPRFTFGLMGLVILAVLVGVIAGKSQTPTAAAPPASPQPSPVPALVQSAINIVAHPGGSPTAIYRVANGTGPVSARVGQRVTWINTDTVSHTVTADNSAFGSNPLGHDATFSWTPKKPGVYQYGCYIHPDMHGTLIVRS